MKMKALIRPWMTVCFCLFTLVFAASCGSSDSNQGTSTASNQSMNPVLYRLMMDDLLKSSANCSGLDESNKFEAVKGFMMMLGQIENAKINKSPEFYVGRINEMILQDPALKQSLPTLLKILAVMEYDYDTGRDKEQLAREILGPDMYNANKMRREGQQ